MVNNLVAKRKPLMGVNYEIINYYMQNKPNFRKSQMNVSIFSQKAYENISDWTLGENKPNFYTKYAKTNPIKPNFNPKTR
ncbi:MAG: hypothetical protein V3W45_00950 [Sedimentisphaerales bacterium]